MTFISRSKYLINSAWLLEGIISLLARILKNWQPKLKHMSQTTTCLRPKELVRFWGVNISSVSLKNTIPLNFQMKYLASKKADSPKMTNSAIAETCYLCFAFVLFQAIFVLDTMLILLCLFILVSRSFVKIFLTIHTLYTWSSTSMKPTNMKYNRYMQWVLTFLSICYETAW